MFKAGFRMVHVPYRGVAPALTNLLGGQVQVVFGAVTATMPYISTGKVRALAVTGTARSELLPDIPTVGELVPGYEASAWYGIGALKGTERIAVGRRAYERLGGNVGPGARPVLNDDGLAQPFLQPLTDQAPDDIGPSAGGKAYEQAHRTRRIGLCPRHAR